MIVDSIIILMVVITFLLLFGGIWMVTEFLEKWFDKLD